MDNKQEHEREINKIHIASQLVIKTLGQSENSSIREAGDRLNKRVKERKDKITRDYNEEITAIYTHSAIKFYGIDPFIAKINVLFNVGAVPATVGGAVVASLALAHVAV